MKSLSTFGILILCLAPIFAFGAIPPVESAVNTIPKPTAKTSVAVKFDHSFYKLEFSRDNLSYSESGRAYSIRKADCNRRKLSEIEDAFQALQSENSHQPPRQKTEYDVEVATNKKEIFVARGNNFGTWLRDLPKRIMYINAEAQALCKR